MNKEQEDLIVKYVEGGFFSSTFAYLRLVFRRENITGLVNEYYREKYKARSYQTPTKTAIYDKNKGLTFEGNPGMCVPPYEEYEPYEKDNDVDLITAAILAQSIADSQPDYTPDTSPVFGGGGDFGGGGSGGSWSDDSSSSSDSGGGDGGGGD